MLCLWWCWPFGVVGQAHAVPYTDRYHGGHSEWRFDIRECGYDPETEAIICAEVTLNLEDTMGAFSGFSEVARLHVGRNVINWQVDRGERTWMLTSLMILSETGTVDCSLANLWDGYSLRSALSCRICRQARFQAPSPERCCCWVPACLDSPPSAKSWTRTERKKGELSR